MWGQPPSAVRRAQPGPAHEPASLQLWKSRASELSQTRSVPFGKLRTAGGGCPHILVGPCLFFCLFLMVGHNGLCIFVLTVPTVPCL
jgi:hypothetical protein